MYAQTRSMPDEISFRQRAPFKRLDPASVPIRPRSVAQLVIEMHENRETVSPPRVTFEPPRVVIHHPQLHHTGLCRKEIAASTCLSHRDAGDRGRTRAKPVGHTSYMPQRSRYRYIRKRREGILRRMVVFGYRTSTIRHEISCRFRPCLL